MFCMNCGQGLPEEAKVCPSCGQEINRDIDFQDVKRYAGQKVQSTIQPVQMKARDFQEKLKEEKEDRKISGTEEIFLNRDEEMEGILGERYLNTLVGRGILKKGFAVLTNRRFYYRGKCFHSSGRGLYRTDEERAVGLADITSSGLIYSRNFMLLILAVAATLLTAFLSVTFYQNWEDGLAIVSLIVGGVLSAGIWVGYLLYKRAFYEISFAGGTVSIMASDYGMEEIHEFDRRLWNEKDKNGER